MGKPKYKRCKICGKQLPLEEDDVCIQCHMLMEYSKELYGEKK